MLVIFRADASVLIGSGHIMRCLTLADYLRKHGAEVYFICREFSGNLCSYIRNKEYNVEILPDNNQSLLESNGNEFLNVPWQTDAEQTKKAIEQMRKRVDWLIVDQYSLDRQWQSVLRSVVSNIMVIDDLANRRHDCDILLDQNYYYNKERRYSKLVPKGCHLFLGPRYVLLREEFYKIKRKQRLRSGEVNSVLVFYGGSDPTNETEKLLMSLMNLAKRDFEIHVITGESNLNKTQIANLCSTIPKANYYCQISNMAELINQADIAFGAGGATIWERCFLGLPTLVTITAANQIEITEAVADFGAIINLGWYEQVDESVLRENFENVLREPGRLLYMRQKSLELMGLKKPEGIEEIISFMFLYK